MKRGDVVLVKAYPNKQLERIVWEVHASYVLVCRAEVFADAIERRCEPESTMGFPQEDVVQVPPLHTN